MMRRQDCIFGKVIDLLVGVGLFVFGLFSVAKTLLTKSRSVTIPIGVLFSITIRLATSFCVIRAAASITVLVDSIVRTFWVITSFTLVINYHSSI